MGADFMQGKVHSHGHPGMQGKDALGCASELNWVFMIVIRWIKEAQAKAP